MTDRLPMPLTRLLDDAGLFDVDITGNGNTVVTGISTHAQGTARNEMFVALVGNRVDSHMLLSEAVEAGASVLLVENDSPPYPGVTQVRVPDTRQALGHLAQAFHGRPTRAMNVCGITGTNGKTSTTQHLGSILRVAGARVGMIGTLGAQFAGENIPFLNTTPGPLELAAVLSRMERANIGNVIMEVSSHAVDQGRINGIPFRCGALTNISRDHLDYHGSFENYMLCKRRFFTDHVATTPGSFSVLNIDDPLGEELFDSYTEDLLSYSLESPLGDVRAENVRLAPHRTQFDLVIDGKAHPVRTTIGGMFNVANMVAAAACAFSMGVDAPTIAEGLEHAPQVPGRLEFIDEGQPFAVIVDYAHTPDALERVLHVARRYTTGRVLTVFGCGGDRDRGKRPLMGRAAGDLADFVIVTNDNPRTESPERIARHVIEGVLQSRLKTNRYTIELDREVAITRALEMALPGDVIVLAGKGHEDYQEVGTLRLPFDDRAVARDVLGRLAGTTNPSPAAEIPAMEAFS